MLYPREKTCCFTGHRPEKLPWKKNEADTRCIALKDCLYHAVESAYWEKGMRHFICGMALGCDMYFAEAVLQLQKEHPEVTLEGAIPCSTQTERWFPEEIARQQSILQHCDNITLIQINYTSTCMHRRNRYMVDHASLVLAVHGGLPGGTRQTILYAMQQGVEIVDIPCELKNKGK